MLSLARRRGFSPRSARSSGRQRRSATEPPYAGGGARGAACPGARRQVRRADLRRAPGFDLTSPGDPPSCSRRGCVLQIELEQVGTARGLRRREGLRRPPDRRPAARSRRPVGPGPGREDGRRSPPQGAVLHRRRRHAGCTRRESHDLLEIGYPYGDVPRIAIDQFVRARCTLVDQPSQALRGHRFGAGQTHASSLALSQPVGSRSSPSSLGRPQRQVSPSTWTKVWPIQPPAPAGPR